MLGSPLGDRWSARLADGCVRAGVPGAVLALRQDGQVEIATYGVLDTRTSEPVTAESLFQIGSMSKLVTAVLAGQLVAEGRLGWHTIVADVLPEAVLPGGADNISVQHLLTHSSGIDGDVFDDTGSDEGYAERYLALLERQPSLFAPGAAYSYCNAGFVVLGEMIARLDGRLWDESVAARVAAPLAWSRWSTFRQRVPMPGAAHGHRERPQADKTVSVWALPRALDPAGGLILTASGVLELAAGIFDRGDSRLIGADLRSELVREQLATPHLAPGLHGVGLAVRRHVWSGGLLVGHDGTTSGQHAYLRVAPEHGFAVALLTNGGEAHVMAEALLAEVVDAALGWTPLDPRGPLPVDERPPVDDTWVGTYRGSAATYEVERDVAAGLVARLVPAAAVAELLDEEEHIVELVPSAPDGRSHVVRVHDDQPWTPWTFDDRPGVGPHMVLGGRVTPRAV